MLKYTISRYLCGKIQRGVNEKAGKIFCNRICHLEVFWIVCKTVLWSGMVGLALLLRNVDTWKPECGHRSAQCCTLTQVQGHHALMQTITLSSSRIMRSCSVAASPRLPAQRRWRHASLQLPRERQQDVPLRIETRTRTAIGWEKLSKHFELSKALEQIFLQAREINLAAFKLARQVADEGGCLVSISLNEPTSYQRGESEENVKEELRQQLKFFVDEGCRPDFVACEVLVITQTRSTNMIDNVPQFSVPRLHPRTGAGDRRL